MFVINPGSGSPIYRQLMEQIQRMVSSGRLRAGDTLPSVRELALDHAVNPMTVSRAYSLLEAEGILERRRGKGMVVAERDTAARESRAERRERLQPLMDQLATAARQLELDPDDVIEALRKTMEKEKKK